MIVFLLAWNVVPFIRLQWGPVKSITQTIDSSPALLACRWSSPLLWTSSDFLDNSATSPPIISSTRHQINISRPESTYNSNFLVALPSSFHQQRRFERTTYWTQRDSHLVAPIPSHLGIGSTCRYMIANFFNIVLGYLVTYLNASSATPTPPASPLRPYQTFYSQTHT
jgi:hypothetical protein